VEEKDSQLKNGIKLFFIMLNKIYKNLQNNWHWAAFGLLLFLSTVFLMKPGIWMFADSGFYYQSASQSFEVLISKLGLFTRTDGFYLGYDNSATAFSHLMILAYQTFLTLIFGATAGQYLFYFLFYFLTFFFGLKLIRELCSDYGEFAIRLGALFLTFNPFALLISTLFTVGYVYPLFIVFFYSFLLFSYKGRYIYLFGSIIGGLYLLSYLRLVPIVVATFLGLLIIFYNNKYFNFKRWLIFIFVFLVCASPFIVSSTFSLASQESIVNNYASAFSRYDQANYDFKSLFINAWSHPGGFTPSTLSYYYNPTGLPGFADNYASSSSVEIYKIIQAFFNISLLLLLLLYVRQKRAVALALIILGVVGVNAIGFFVNPESFSFIHSTFLVFLYNDFGFLQFIQAIISSFALVILASWAQRRGVIFSSRVVIIVGLYLVLCILPLTSTHYGLSKLQKIDPFHSQLLENKNIGDEPVAAFFAPYHWAKFDWAPYFLDVNNSHYTKNSSLVVPNLRIIGRDFADFYNGFYDKVADPNFSNVRIFNLKNIFIFHDIQDANQNIDAYQAYNQESIADRIEQQIGGNSGVKLIDRNEKVSKYIFTDEDKYDFLLYSPKKIEDVGFDGFYNKPFDLSQRPVVVSRTDLPALQFFNPVEFSLNSPQVQVKISPNNPNKYFVRVRVIKDHPFLLQFNQMYSKSWRLYFVDKKVWDEAPCQTTVNFYELSNSAFCQYAGLPIDLADSKLLKHDYLKPENHGTGNFINNLFLVTPQDIPREFKDGEELYFVVYFQKQIYYQYALVVSLLTVVILLILAVADIIKGRKKHD
jgi:hypothetical protein